MEGMESATKMRGRHVLRALFIATSLAGALCLVQAQPAFQNVALDALNTSDDEVLLGWDGSSLYYRSIPRSSDSVKSGDWFLTPGQEYVAEVARGWTEFGPPQTLDLRAWSAAEWPGMGEIQHVAIDSDRGVLVLSALEPTGDFDLYMAQRTGGSWGLPMALKGLNTPSDEVFPNFDDGALLFASNGHPGWGGFDLFRSERQSNFSVCDPLPRGVNTSGDELAAVPVGDGDEMGFYVSAVRMDGRGVDLWWAGTLQEELTKPVKALAVELVHRRQPVARAEFELRERGGQWLMRNATDAQGRLELGAVALDASLEVSVSMGDGSSIPDGTICHVFERCASPGCSEAHWPGWKRVRSYRIAGGKAFVFDLLPLDALRRWPRPSGLDAALWQVDAAAWTAFFPTSSASLAAEQAEALADWVAQVNWNREPGYFEVRGYTDARGEAVKNQLLSEARAKEAVGLLLGLQVPLDRVKSSGHGVALDGVESAGRRRVEVRWVSIE